MLSVELNLSCKHSIEMVITDKSEWLISHRTPNQRYVSDGKVILSYCLHAWKLSCNTIKQQAFQTRAVGLPQHLGDPQPITCTTIDGFVSLDGPQGRDLIRLVPQLLK